MITTKTKLLEKILALLALAILSGCSGDLEKTSVRIEDVASRYMERDHVPGFAMIVLDSGKVTHRVALGVADQVSQRPVTTTTLFRVESLSKPVAAWGAMRLAEAGQLDLDAPIAKKLDEWAFQHGVAQLTTRQLLSHTAGLGLGDFTARYPPGSDLPSLKTFLSKDIVFERAPGSGFSYSDTGFILLELVLEASSDRRFGPWIMEHVSEPLGMSEVTFDGTAENLATGHDLDGHPVEPYVYPGLASGGLIASADAVAAFVQAGWSGADQAVLSAAMRAELYQPVVPVGGLYGFAAESYGLGYFIETLSDGRKAVWHGGQGYGWMSHFHLIPETGDGLIMLSNSQRAWPLFAAVLKHWSGQIGVEPVGMSRVLFAETLARIIIGVLVLLAALACLSSWRRQPLPASLRLFIGINGGLMILVPVWIAFQEYLFIFSILPTLWYGLAAAMAACGVSLLALARLARPVV